MWKSHKFYTYIWGHKTIHISANVSPIIISLIFTLNMKTLKFAAPRDNSPRHAIVRVEREKTLGIYIAKNLLQSHMRKEAHIGFSVKIDECIEEAQKYRHEIQISKSQLSQHIRNYYGSELNETIVVGITCIKNKQTSELFTVADLILNSDDDLRYRISMYIDNRASDWLMCKKEKLIFNHEAIQQHYRLNEIKLDLLLTEIEHMDEMTKQFIAYWNEVENYGFPADWDKSMMDEYLCDINDTVATDLNDIEIIPL